MSDTILEQAAAPAALVAVNGKEYPLESARIVARAEGGMALSTLVQRFANPHDEPLEVRYTMPLPADGAVLGYTVRIGERVIRAEVQPREKASAAYKKALFEGRTAGLLEQSRPDTFQQSLGNVPAKTAVEVTIEVLHPLAFLAPASAPRSGAAHAEATGALAQPHWEYRFPTVVGVRYHGAPGRVPDAQDLSPDRAAGGLPVRMGLQLTIADELPSPAAASPSHALDVAPAGPGCVVTFREGERLDRDVVVRWLAAAKEVGVRVAEGGGLEGDDGRYALVTLVPPALPGRTFGRDVTVLLDASGSMSGQPLDLAKRVVGELLRSLGERDRFELLAFATGVKKLTKGLVKADARAIARGIDAVNGLQAIGGTEMVAGIRAAMTSARGDAQRQVVLVTDGQIGFEHEVVARVADAENVRLHVVGVGHAPNRSLTQQAAFAGRGVELTVTNEQDAGTAGHRLVTATAAPVLTGLQVRGSALAGEQVSRLRDVFAASPLLFTAELSPAGGTLELKGSLAGEPWSHRVTVPARAAAGEALAATTLPLGALHGRALVAVYELGTPARWGARRDDARIERCAMRHRIASSATSLVAIAEEPSVDPNEPRRRERLAVELPAGVSAEGVGLEPRIAGGPLYESLAMMKGAAVLSALANLEKASHWRGPADATRVGSSSPVRRSTDVNCHWLDDELLVVDFEPAQYGLWLQGETVDVTFGRGRHERLLVLPIEWAHSTLRRAIRPGLRIKVTIRVPRDLAGAALRHARMELRWGPVHTDEVTEQVTVAFQVPDRPAPPAPAKGATSGS